MNSKEALEFLTETWGQCYRCSKYDECHQLEEHETICENAKFIIIKSLNRLEKLEKEIKDGTLSDGYHTFNELYEQRMYLFATIVNQNKELAWKSLKHEDGKLCFDGDWFIVGIDTPRGSYTYHYETNYWSLFDCQELEVAKHWDGHTSKDVSRLLSLEPKLEILKEKATPKRPITIKPEGKSIFDYPTNRIKCPNCGVQLPMKKNCLKKKIPITYCDRCGQKLDWSDENE